MLSYSLRYKNNRIEENRTIPVENFNLVSSKSNNKIREGKESKSDTHLNICSYCQEGIEAESKKPNWKWDIEPNATLCNECYKKKSNEYDIRINFCNTCYKKLGFIRYNPKRSWNIQGQMCRNCWDSKNSSD